MVWNHVVSVQIRSAPPWPCSSIVEHLILNQDVVGATNGKKLYTINSTGDLKSEDCCSCSNKICTKCAPDTSVNCKLINGTGSNQINVFVYGDNQAQMEDWGQWIYSMLLQRTPYNEYTFNLYYEKTQGSCSNIRHSSKDFDASLATWVPAIGYSSFDRVTINHIWFNPARTSNLKWEFLLFHELGHDYARMGHSNDGSIMDANGGDAQYRDYQIKTIRNSLTTGN